MEAVLQKNIKLLLICQNVKSFFSKTLLILNALIRIGKGDTKIGKTYVLGSPESCPDY